MGPILASMIGLFQRRVKFYAENFYYMTVSKGVFTWLLHFSLLGWPDCAVHWLNGHLETLRTHSNLGPLKIRDSTLPCVPRSLTMSKSYDVLITSINNRLWLWQRKNWIETVENLRMVFLLPAVHVTRVTHWWILVLRWSSVLAAISAQCFKHMPARK